MFANASMKWNSNNTTVMWIYEVCWLLRITWKCCCRSNLSKWTVMRSWQFIVWLHSWMINVSTELSSQNHWFKILKCIRVLGRILLLRFFFFILRLQYRNKMVVYISSAWKGNIGIKLFIISVWTWQNMHQIVHMSTSVLKVASTIWCDKRLCFSYSFGIYFFLLKQFS